MMRTVLGDVILRVHGAREAGSQPALSSKQGSTESWRFCGLHGLRQAFSYNTRWSQAGL